MSSRDLQTIFSSLEPASHDHSPASPDAASFPRPASRPSSSTFFHTVPVPTTPPPPFSAVADEHVPENNQTMNRTRTTNAATAQNLLNLLNFGGQQNTAQNHSQPVSSPSATSAVIQPNPGGPISASDLVARFMSPAISTPKLEDKDDVVTAPQPDASSSRSQLLELLNKQASVSPIGGTAGSAEEHEEEIPEADDPVRSIEDQDYETGPGATHSRVGHDMTAFGTVAGQEHVSFEAPNSAGPAPPSQEHKSIFTYTNPFEALNASRNQTPAVSTSIPPPPPASTPNTFAFQQSPGLSSPVSISARRKLTPKLRSQRSVNAELREESPVATSIHKDDLHQVAPPEDQHVQPSAETAGTVQSHVITVDVGPTEDPQEEKKAVEEETQDNQDDSAEWEDADESPDKGVEPRRVPVYTFPIKPFVSITLQLGASSDIDIREDGVMEISRLKKDFDQLDRSLAAATSNYITYAFVKNGGMRIIRQDDGSDRHVFKNSHDRIFNVSFCTTAVNATASDNQAVLGTGVSGAVYHATVSKEGNDLFEKNQLDLESLIFPPYPQVDENTAGGVLKTRAKRSSRHPEYFAIGRGKSIHLIWPATALSPRYGINDTNRTVDVEKFYSDRPLQVSTGKAGKDFTFSEDDTLIVSLDKTGRLRFWDIRGLVDESNATAARVSPVIVDTPILSLSTASPAEKSWPTSVTFVDKSRPYKKGGALRYVLVGLRQNHTLQLWDIALGKAVQELNFPHENETDGICSVNFHPESGIIVVSHPTRNSIFFIHLSAPRHSLSSQMSQATYVERIANKDPELPKPESTACMSGIREISFAEKGQLRSVELLPVQKSSDTLKDESAPLFELYVVHSKGVTCLGINREDLGWNADNKVLYPVDAQQEGLVSLKELKLGSVIEEPIRTKSPTKEAPQPTKATKKKKKLGQPSEDTVNGVEPVQHSLSTTGDVPPVLAPTEMTQSEPSGHDTSTAKETKKAKKRAEKAAQAVEQLSIQQDAERTSSPAKSLPIQQNGQPEPTISEPLIAQPTAIQKSEVAASNAINEDWLDAEFKKIERSVSSEFKRELDALYRSIQSDRAAQDSSSASRQEAILRLVSSSLSTNVEKSLSRILGQQMQQIILPVVIQHTSAQIADTLKSTLLQTLPQEISVHLPTAVSDALQSPHMSRTVAESVTQKLSKQLESQMTDLIAKTVSPIFQKVASAAAERAASDTEARLTSQIQKLQIDREEDNEKLDRLSSVIQGMASTLQAMSDSQVAFQGQILRDRQTSAMAGSSGIVATSRQVSTARGTPDSAILSKPKSKPMRIRSKADIELEEITNLMNEGRYEEGSIKWLQSAQPVKLFDELFVRFTPEYLATDVSPLVAFSVAVTVANSLSTNTERRLEWIAAAFDAVDLQDPEIADLSQHAPALITSLVQKLESLYMTMAERNPSDPVLRFLPPLAKKGRDMKTAFIARATGSFATNFPQLTTANF